MPSTVCRSALPAHLQYLPSPRVAPLMHLQLPSQLFVLTRPAVIQRPCQDPNTPSHPPLHLHSPLSACGEGTEDT